MVFRSFPNRTSLRACTVNVTNLQRFCFEIPLKTRPRPPPCGIGWVWAEILKIYLFSIRFRIICKSSFIARLHRECYEASECLLFHCIFKGCASKFFVLHFKDVHRSSSFSNITVANQARQIKSVLFYNTSAFH